MRLLGKLAGMGFLPGLGGHGLFLDAVADDRGAVVTLDNLLDRAQLLGVAGVLGIRLALEVAPQEQGKAGQHQDEELRRAAHFSPCEVRKRSAALAAGKAMAMAM